MKTSEFLFWFTVEPGGIICQAFIGVLLMSLSYLIDRLAFTFLAIFFPRRKACSQATYRFVFFHLGDQQEIPKLIRKVRSLLSLSASPNVKLFIKPFSQYLAQLEWSAVMLQLCSAAVGK